MGEIDFDGADPIYAQLAAVIESRIEDGTYQPNRKIPSEAQLRDEFDVSNTTVRGAIRVLVSKGLVRTVVGRGVFVLRPDDEEA